MLDKGNMERVNYLSTVPKPASVSLSISHIANEYAFCRSRSDFRVGAVNENKSATANFTKVCEGRRIPVPELKGRLTIQDLRDSESGEVRCSEDELVPQIERCVTEEAHGSGFVHEGTVESLDTTILRRGVRSSEMLCYAMLGTPASHFTRS